MSTSTTKNINRSLRKKRTAGKKQVSKRKQGLRAFLGRRKQGATNMAKSAPRSQRPRRGWSSPTEWDPSAFKTDLTCKQSWSTQDLTLEESPRPAPQTAQERILAATQQQEREVEAIEAQQQAMRDRIKQQEADFLQLTQAALEEGGALMSEDSEKETTPVPPAIRIPRQTPRQLNRKRQSSLGKRNCNEIPADLRSPTTEGEKRFKFEAQNADERKIQSGERVKVIRAAKKKWLGCCGVVEKYLHKKQKWGLILDAGNRIALAPEALKILPRVVVASVGGATLIRRHSVKANPHGGPTPTPSPSPSPKHAAEPMPPRPKPPSAARLALAKRVKVKRTKRAKKRWGRVKIQMAAVSAFKMDDVVSASMDELMRFKANFGAESRPKTAQQMMLAACVAGRLDVIKALMMNHNTDIHMDNGARQTLLHVAIENGQQDCALLLLEMGIEIDPQDAQGRTALMLAAAHAMPEVATALCQSGARINQRDQSGQTALIVAARKGCTDVLSVLLGHGAEMELTDGEEKTALDHAMSNSEPCHKRAAELITAKMQEPQLHRERDQRLKIARRTTAQMGQMELPKLELPKHVAYRLGRKPGRKTLIFYR